MLLLSSQSIISSFYALVNVTKHRKHGKPNGIGFIVQKIREVDRIIN